MPEGGTMLTSRAQLINSTPIAAVRVPDYQPPTWPGGEMPKQIHLDLAVGVGELDAAEAEAIRLGARRADEQPGAALEYPGPAEHRMSGDAGEGSPSR